MKTGYNILLTVVFIVCLTLLTSCAAPPKLAGVQITPQVDLHVVGNPKELKVIKPGSPPVCPPATPVNHRNGCVFVGKSDTALINFELKTSPVWQFEKIQICNGAAKAGMVCTFAPWQQSEFYATDAAGTKVVWPDASGVIDLTTLPGKQTEFYLFDYNSIKQDYFYTITVCNLEDSADCIPTDPPLTNGGRR